MVSFGDIIPGHGERLVRLDPLTGPRRTRPWTPLRKLTQGRALYPGTRLARRYEVKSRPDTA